MLKKNLKTLIVTSIVTLLPILVGLLLWDKLPEQMPFHWGPSGEVDGWTSKQMAVLLMPFILVAIEWFCAWAANLDPKANNIANKSLKLILWFIPVLSIFINGIVYLSALGHDVSVEVIMPAFMGVIFMIIGNYLPKCKQSYTLGIKLPWTLHDEENWNRTHRFAGKLWFIGGLLMICTSFLGSFVAFGIITALMILIPTVYSYKLFKTKNTEELKK